MTTVLNVFSVTYIKQVTSMGPLKPFLIRLVPITHSSATCAYLVMMWGLLVNRTLKLLLPLMVRYAPGNGLFANAYISTASHSTVFMLNFTLFNKSSNKQNCFGSKCWILMCAIHTTALLFTGIIYAFNTKIPSEALNFANAMNVPIKEHNVIYKLIDDLREEITKRLEPVEEEIKIGKSIVYTNSVKMCVSNVFPKDLNSDNDNSEWNLSLQGKRMFCSNSVSTSARRKFR